MGSNADRHFDKKATSEWGSKGRKESTHEKRRRLDEQSIIDSMKSNTVSTGFNTPSSLEPFVTPEWEKPKKRSKNTKKWCKGREGREHDPSVIEHHRFYINTRCSKCHKSLSTEWTGMFKDWLR